MTIKKLFLSVFVLAIAATSVIVSCKKSSSTSVSSELIGTWKTHEIIFDSNNNGKIDAADPIIQYDTANSIIKFSSNGTFTTSCNTCTPGTGTWTLVANNSYIKTVDTSGITSNIYITSISGSSLTVADTTSHPLTWLVLNKQ